MKAAIIIESMPEGCQDCPLCRPNGLELRCQARYGEYDIKPIACGLSRPGWCLLWQMED